MSGLACIYRADQELDESSALEVVPILNILRHRGGSGQKTFAGRKAVLGCVFDVEPGSGGNDKYYYEDEKGAIALDGSFAGFKSLDEVLGLYRRKGASFLKEMEGQFSLLVMDKGKLFAARDPFGIKPLYYARHGDYIMFASELKAINDDWGNTYSFPPGHYFEDRVGFQEYFAFPKDLDQVPVNGVEDATAKLRILISEAVKKRVVNGHGQSAAVFLSGGLDSSIMAALTAKYLDKPQTFATGYGNSNDLVFAREVAEHIGAVHTEYLYDEAEILNVLPQVIYHLESFDQALVRSSIANYLVARAAAEEGCEAAICGEGSDELFAGYHYLKGKPEDEIKEELYRLTQESHHMAFQRVDRMCGAHSLEVEMPFVDRDVVSFAFSLPVEWKLHGKPQMEKWLLRKAFTHLLPEDVVWRKKEQFSSGAGSEDVLVRVAEEKITDAEFERERRLDGISLKTKEELLYFRIFKEYFPQKKAAETVGHWQPV